MLTTAAVVGRQHAEADQLEEARVDHRSLVDVVGPLSPMVYVVPAFGLPSLVSRRKYGFGEYGPFVVTVQPLTCACQASAVAR